MKSSSAIYINVIKLPNQLKLDYKLIKKNSIVKTEQASFLVYDETMTKDILFKLESLQKEDKNCYISTILNTNEQFICNNDELSKYNSNEYDFISLYNKTTIVTPKNTVFETKHYFEKSGIDYIFSPYQILTHYILDNPAKNNVVILIIANIVYIMITDSNASIIYNVIKKLTPFDDIKNSQFYDDEIKGQKLFDEIYFFELQDIIKEVLEEFYAKNPKSDFLEKINILHTLKQLDNDEIVTLKETFAMDVSYHPISLDNYIYELVNSKNNKKSFISPRKRASSYENIFWLGSAMAATFITVYLLYDFYNTKELGTTNQQPQIIKQQDVIKSDLIDHISKNTAVSTLIQDIFNIIPYNVVLNEVVIDKNDSILVCDFLEKDTFVKIIQPEILKLYESTDIIFDEENKQALPVLTGVIKNTNIISQRQYQDKIYTYNKTSFSYTMMQETIQNIMLPDWQIIYIKTYADKQVNYNLFEINMSIKSPQEFTDFIDKINSLPHSITIEHPVKFIKNIQTGMIDMKFYLSFNQSI
ncbi:MAG: hypothetical protein AB1389_05940 [Campylobacterota bacterium]